MRCRCLFAWPRHAVGESDTGVGLPETLVNALRPKDERMDVIRRVGGRISLPLNGQMTSSSVHLEQGFASSTDSFPITSSQRFGKGGVLWLDRGTNFLGVWPRDGA